MQSRALRMLPLFAVVFTTLPSQGQQVIFVDSSTTVAATQQNGSSWATPYKNLTQALTVVKSLLGPAQIILKSGTKYQGPVVIDGFNAGLTIKAEDHATTPPLITCSKKPSSWSLHGGSIYKTPILASSPTKAVSQVFFNQRFLPIAKYPSTGFIQSGGNPTDKLTVIPKATDLNFLKTRDLRGMRIAGRIIDYWFNNSVVTGLDSSGTALKLSPTSLPECYPQCEFYYPLNLDWGYQLQGKLWMISSPGSWAYEKNQGQLFVRLPGDISPLNTSPDLEYSDFEDCLTVQNSSQVLLDRIHIGQGGGDGIVIFNSNGVTLNGVTIRDVARRGVRLHKSHSFHMKWSAVIRTGSEALRAGNQEALPSGMTTSGNLIENSYFSEIGMAVGPQHLYAAIFLSGDFYIGTQFRNNVINRTAYSGIFGPRQGVVFGNRFEDTCLWLDDCGAIYTAIYEITQTIENNLVLGATANLEGKPPSRKAFPVAGIYLDDLAQGVTVRNNRIVNTDLGFMLHNTYDNLIVGNKVSHFRVAGLRSQEDMPLSERLNGVFVPILDGNGQTQPSMKNNRILQNEFIDTLGIKTFLIGSNQGQGAERIKESLTFESNLYSDLFKGNFIEFTNSMGLSSMNFKDYKALFEQTAVNVNNTGFQIPSYLNENYLGLKVAQMGKALNGFSSWSAAGNHSLQSSSLCTSGSPTCWRFRTSTTGGLVASNPFSIGVGEKLSVSVTLKNLKPVAVSIKLPLRRAGPTYEVLSVEADSTYVLNAYQQVQLEFYPRSFDRVSAARLDLEAPAGADLLISKYEVQRVVEPVLSSLVDMANSSHTFRTWSAATLPQEEETLSDESNCSFKFIDTRCLHFRASTTHSSLLSSRVFNIEQGQFYRARIGVFLEGAAGSQLELAARKNIPAYESLDSLNLPSKTQLRPGAWNFIEWHFRAAATFDQARLDLSFSPGAQAIITQFSVQQVNPQKRIPGDYWRVEVNKDPRNSTLVSCSSDCLGWFNTEGLSINYPIGLGPISTQSLWNPGRVRERAKGF